MPDDERTPVAAPTDEKEAKRKPYKLKKRHRHGGKWCDPDDPETNTIMLRDDQAERLRKSGTI